ncbi:hypothetical protein, partial [Haloarcula marismortui]|uniref:hypothetical protein n=1 Tax=Haloarcula marismortui TaxID=2238 RepID=UPI0019D38DD8
SQPTQENHLSRVVFPYFQATEPLTEQIAVPLCEYICDTLVIIELSVIDSLVGVVPAAIA